MRPAVLDDIAVIHPRLMEAISTSPFYGETFKRYEMARLNRAYLAALIEADPHHVFIPQVDGKTAGFMISGPELGTLWLYWSYIFPEMRRSTIALSSLRHFLAHWDKGRFHKVSTFTRPDNRVAEALLERYGFSRTCVLEKHIFGEDYCLFERPLERVDGEYDRGVSVGLAGRLKTRLRSILKP